MGARARGGRTIKVSAAIAIGMTLVLVAFIAQPRIWHDPVAPEDAVGMARWMSQHPADWYTASQLADRALDARIDRRFELWHSAWDVASHLAPLRPNPRAGFVRAGLFHWYELSAADQKRVIAALEPMLGDPQNFAAMYQSLWSLTHDFDLLRRAKPRDLNSIYNLRELAATHGRFDDYRALGDELRRARAAEIAAGTKSAAELFAIFPPDLEAADIPLVKSVLDELHRRPVDMTSGSLHTADAVIDFALEHNIQPLDGLEHIARSETLVAPSTRARLALRLGHADLAARIATAHAAGDAPDWKPYHRERARFEARRGDSDAAAAEIQKAGTKDAPGLFAAAEVAEILGQHEAADAYRAELASSYGQLRDWQGLCGTDLCRSATRWLYAPAPRTLTVQIAPVQSDEVPAYVELYVDHAFIGGGPVAAPATITIPITKDGLHHVEARIANPYTRNRVQRRVRLS